MPDDRLKAFFVDFIREIFAVGLEGGNHVQLVSIQKPWADSAAINHQAGPVEPCHSHDGAGHVLVASGKRDQCVIPLRADDGLDRIGDEVPGLQGVFHALRAH